MTNKDRANAIEIAKDIENSILDRKAGMRIVSRALLSEVERSAKLLKALEEIDVQTRWRTEKQLVNFCSEDCPPRCREHIAERDRKVRNLCNGDIARQAIKEYEENK